MIKGLPLTTLHAPEAANAPDELWEARRSCFAEGSAELTLWVDAHEARLYDDDVDAVIVELRARLAEVPKTGPGNKGRRKRLSDAIRCLADRHDRFVYGTCRKRDLEVGTGQVEGAIKYVIAKRCDHGGMRWVRERAQAVIQLRCIDVNAQWDAFVRWTLGQLRTAARELGRRIRLQTQVASNCHLLDGGRTAPDRYRERGVR